MGEKGEGGGGGGGGGGAFYQRTLLWGVLEVVMLMDCVFHLVSVSSCICFPVSIMMLVSLSHLNLTHAEPLVMTGLVVWSGEQLWYVQWLVVTEG